MPETITSIKKSSGNCKIYFISHRNKLRNKNTGHFARYLRAI